MKQLSQSVRIACVVLALRITMMPAVSVHALSYATAKAGTFTAVNKIGAYYEEVTKGTSSTTFSPDDVCIREQWKDLWVHLWPRIIKNSFYTNS